MSFGEAGTLRFLSFNIHGCVGRGGRESAGPVLEVIRRCNADVVALQEVYDHDEETHSFLRGLERFDYMSILYGPTMRRHPGSYGNILMSRLPVIEEERIDLSMDEAEPRGAIRALLQKGGGKIGVVGTHLGLASFERNKQLERLRALRGITPSQGEADLRLLMGDLNEWWYWSRNMRAFRRDFPVRSKCRTFPAVFPLFPLDRISVSGEFSNARFTSPRFREARIASDHRPVLAEIAPAF
ncbi:MAG: endonuclease/exonuclease/phosphatase family protein [Opitutales bacterium]